MNELHEVQKELAQKARSMTWSRAIKTWPLDDLLQNTHTKPLTVSQVIAGLSVPIEGNKPKMRVSSFADTLKSLQQKITKTMLDTAIDKATAIQWSQAPAIICIRLYSKQQVVLELQNTFFASNAIIVFCLDPDTHLTLVEKHSLKKNTYGSLSILFLVEKDSTVDHVVVAPARFGYFYRAQYQLGEAATVHSVVVSQCTAEYLLHSFVINHTRNHSKGSVTGMLDCKKNTKCVVQCINNHQGKHTTGDMAINVVGRDKAKAKIDGLIEIGKKALFTNSYLQEDVLLATEQADIDAQPNLEILNNEVSASHGATLAPIDPVQVMYLQSRGITPSAAEELILQGFLQAATNRLYNELTKEKVTAFFKE